MLSYRLYASFQRVDGSCYFRGLLVSTCLSLTANRCHLSPPVTRSQPSVAICLHLSLAHSHLLLSVSICLHLSLAHSHLLLSVFICLHLSPPVTRSQPSVAICLHLSLAHSHLLLSVSICHSLTAICCYLSPPV
jgi:hypothetical protein